MKFYLTNLLGEVYFEGSEDEMFRLLSLEPSNSEDLLYGPFFRDEYGEIFLHPEGIPTPDYCSEGNWLI